MKVKPRALILIGMALEAPVAILWAKGAIQGPRPLYIGPGTYWVGWLLISVPIAALVGVVLIVAGAALALFRRGKVR